MTLEELKRSKDVEAMMAVAPATTIKLLSVVHAAVNCEKTSVARFEKVPSLEVAAVPFLQLAAALQRLLTESQSR